MPQMRFRAALWALDNVSALHGIDLSQCRAEIVAKPQAAGGECMNIDEKIRAKYADKTTLEHKMAMEAIAMFRSLLGQHRPQFEALIEAERDMHNFGGVVFNPTLFRDMLQSKSFALQIRMVKAALVFLDEIDAVAKELPE